ncbi:MAG: hypothetical protein LBJ99_04520 [Oscillospiraceae bacterium]|nr:hypothetical protein [Oscillospiraceae bacterium]
MGTSNILRVPSLYAYRPDAYSVKSLSLNVPGRPGDGRSGTRFTGSYTNLSQLALGLTMPRFIHATSVSLKTEPCRQ